MLEIEKLEKEWRRYRARRMRPWFTLLFLTIFLVGGYLALKNSGVDINAVNFDKVSTEKKSEPIATRKSYENSEDEKSLNEAFSGNNTVSNPPIENEPAIKAVVSDNREILPRPERDKIEPKEAENRESSVVLNPDIDFLDNISSSRDSERKEYVKPIKHEKIAAKMPSPANHIESKNSEEDEKNTLQEHETAKKSSLLIKSTKANNTLEYLIKRFNEKRDPKLASYIAQSYYKKANYKEAVKWSVMANSLDPSSEETWLIFARSKVKMGQKEDAIKALRVYLNQYSSRNIKSFLQSLESGR